MHEENKTTTTSHEQRTSAPPPDRLMSRLIDGEADARDADAFEQLAADDGQWWRELGVRQCDQARLRDGAGRTLADLDAVELPVSDRPQRDDADRKPVASSPWRPWFALSGWAAAILLLLIGWFAGGFPLGADEGVNDLDRQQSHLATGTATGTGDRRLTPEQHYRAYLSAPFVVGELDPILLEVDEQAGDLLEIRFLRRIEEVLLVPRDRPLPMDADGRFRTDPAELRTNDDDDASR
ncbi:MAG: hypothetical protein EA377_06660 [Phycisphaerales bacterium]|nr:MAG: hypothetical protein EA377_06660 [Phycisphaerales bacterium]